MTRLLVYGSLLRSERLEELTGRSFSDVLFVDLFGYIVRRLDIPGRSARGPGLFPSSPLDQVRGRVVDVTPDELRILDAFEDSAGSDFGGYIRTRVTAKDGNTLLHCQAYVAEESLRRFAVGGWNPVEFDLQFGPLYCERVRTFRERFLAGQSAPV